MGYTTEKDPVHMTEMQVIFVTLIIFLVFTRAIINYNYLLHVFLIMCTIRELSKLVSLVFLYKYDLDV